MSSRRLLMMADDDDDDDNGENCDDDDDGDNDECATKRRRSFELGLCHRILLWLPPGARSCHCEVRHWSAPAAAVCVALGAARPATG